MEGEEERDIGRSLNLRETPQESVPVRKLLGLQRMVNQVGCREHRVFLMMMSNIQ